MASTREAINLAKRVEFWQKRLAVLGLDSWRIESVSVVDETPSGIDARATVQPSHLYKSARFWFTREFVDTVNERELDETIIHEWMHVYMRDLDQAIEEVEYEIAPASRSQWAARVQHEREGFVDALARQIYTIYKAEADATPATLARHAR